MALTTRRRSRQAHRDAAEHEIAVEALPKTASVLYDGLERQLQPGVQVYVSVRGTPVVNAGLGIARPDAGMTSTTVVPWFCGGKPLGAIAAARVWERGDLRLDEPVATYVPELADRGKAAITCRHLLTHMTGWDQDPAQTAVLAPYETVLRIIFGATHADPAAVGRRAAYSMYTNWYLLAEVLRRVTGQDFGTLVEREVLRPLGIDDAWHTVDDDGYDAVEPRLGTVYHAQTSPARANAILTSRDVCQRLIPPIGARGPMRALGRVYEGLLAARRGAKDGLLRAPTVEALVARHRVGQVDPGALDGDGAPTIDWGLGFAVESHVHGADSTYFATHTSDRTFGHSGVQSTVGLADPERDLVICLAFNSIQAQGLRRDRQVAVIDAIYDDLGFASAGHCER